MSLGARQSAPEHIGRRGTRVQEPSHSRWAASPEALQRAVEDLVLERERLHFELADRQALERNRLAIVEAHTKLSLALIALHVHPSA